MRKLSTYLLVLVIAVVGVGCDSDSNDDEISIDELIADGWVLTGVSDADGDQMAVFAQGFSSLKITFTQAGAFTIVVDAIDDAGDNVITGTYSINESTNRITLTTEAQGVPIQLNFNYAFNGDDVVTFAADSVTSTLLNVLLGTTLQGSVSLTVTRT